MLIDGKEIANATADELRKLINAAGASQSEVIIHTSGIYLRNADSGYFNRLYPSGPAGGESATFGPPVGGVGHIGPLGCTGLTITYSADRIYTVEFSIGTPANDTETPDVIQVWARQSGEVDGTLISEHDFTLFPPNQIDVNIFTQPTGTHEIYFRTVNDHGYTDSTNTLTVGVS